MEREYINRKRYENKGGKKAASKPLTKKVSKSTTIDRSIKSSNKEITKKIVKKTKTLYSKKKRYRVLRIAFYIFILCILAICFRLMLKDKYSPFIPPLLKKEIENTQVINIADYGINNLSNTKANNILLSEMEQYIYPMLLNINSDYSINYEVLKSIDKISNTEYLLNINPSYNISADVVKNSIQENISNNTKYSFKFKNLDSINIENGVSIRIKLKGPDPMFIYNLNIPIYAGSENINKTYTIYGNNNLLTLNRSQTASISIPKQITIRNVADLSNAVDMYKAGTIDVFFSSYLSVENLLGKYEYNIKAVNSGQSLFILGNPASNLFSKSEIRKAIAYGLNKNEIISNAINKNGISIDIPFVYNNQRYKYDIYAAENILLSNGYKKNNGIYEKYESGKRIYLELNLIVNKDSVEKNIAANVIKRNLQDIGIKINIINLSEDEINTKIKDSSYDLVLADITLNENPDISKLYSNVKVNENIQNKINSLSNSTVGSINENLKGLINTISDDVAVIGIYSKPTYIIYRKNITLFDNPKFYKLFTNF